MHLARLVRHKTENVVGHVHVGHTVVVRAGAVVAHVDREHSSLALEALFRGKW